MREVRDIPGEMAYEIIINLIFYVSVLLIISDAVLNIN